MKYSRTRVRKIIFGLGITAGSGALLMFVLAAWLWITNPFPMEVIEEWPASPRVEASDGRILIELIGSDQQWRSPVSLDQISPWVVQATLAVEDERFETHHGVDLLAVARATIQNTHKRRVVSGASTITMQICRMVGEKAEGRTQRTLWQKFRESVQSLQLETCMSKHQLLSTYLNIAPYGGNIRGVESAARRYFNKPAIALTLGEAALISGLPQSPSAYYPIAHPDRARSRRSRVLARMLELNQITAEQAAIANAEPIPVCLHAPPLEAPHVAWMALSTNPTGGRLTLDLNLQLRIEQLTQGFAAQWPEDTDASIVVIHIPTGELRTLIGSLDFHDPTGGQVNGAIARRSPGSSLKPFVYGAAFEACRLAPQSSLYDVPINRAAWSPTNFSPGFSGQLTVASALRNSLNIPALLVAEQMGVTRCVSTLQSAGVRLPSDAVHRSGTSAFVGATEVRLLDLTNGYATLARHGRYKSVALFVDDHCPISDSREVFRPEVCRALDAILSSHRQPPATLRGLPIDAIPWFMWKTGTSSGRRDAWAVGHNGQYAIGVWVGRFDGRGNSSYVGSKAAEPLLAALFGLPAIRVENPPEPLDLNVAWEVPPALQIKTDPTSRFAITEPRNGARFIAAGGPSPIQFEASQSDGASWFLNGRLIEPEAKSSGRLLLDPAEYELICTLPSGTSSRVHFTVEHLEPSIGLGLGNSTSRN